MYAMRNIHEDHGKENISFNSFSVTKFTKLDKIIRNWRSHKKDNTTTMKNQSHYLLFDWVLVGHNTVQTHNLYIGLFALTLFVMNKFQQGMVTDYQYPLDNNDPLDKLHPLLWERADKAFLLKYHPYKRILGHRDQNHWMTWSQL